jgi:hypothetical protein
LHDRRARERLLFDLRQFGEPQDAAVDIHDIVAALFRIIDELRTATPSSISPENGQASGSSLESGPSGDGDAGLRITEEEAFELAVAAYKQGVADERVERFSGDAEAISMWASQYAELALEGVGVHARPSQSSRVETARD